MRWFAGLGRGGFGKHEPALPRPKHHALTGPHQAPEPRHALFVFSINVVVQSSDENERTSTADQEAAVPPNDVALAEGQGGEPSSTQTPKVGYPGAPSPEIDEFQLVDALGTAWRAFTLYEDPRHLEVFRRCIASLAKTPRYPWRVDVCPNGFILNGLEVPSTRQATERLAKRIFSHGIGAFVINAPPDGDDLIHIFDIISTGTEALEATGGVEAALERRHVKAIALPLQEVLVERRGFPGTRERSSEWFLGYDGDPEPFVNRMLEESRDNAEKLASRFTEEYSKVYSLIDEEDHWGREDVVHAFVDAFFYLPQDHQAQLLRDLLSQPDREEFLLFLDQFSNQELSQMIEQLTPDAHPLLLEYCRIAADQVGSQRQEDLLKFVEEAEKTSSTQEAVSERIESVLRSVEDDPDNGAVGAIARLREACPSVDDHITKGFDVLTGLLAVVDDEDAFRRLARVWSARVTGAIRLDRLDLADDWFEAVTAAAEHSAERRKTLLQVLGTQVDSDVAMRLAELLTHGETSGPGSTVRRAAPLFAVDGLVEQLGFEEDQARRRKLIEALVAVAQFNVAPLIRHLDDARWYVVRNIILILGRSKHPEVAERLRPLRSHGDHRIRREALRALHHLLGEEVIDVVLAALSDANDAVRRQALLLLRDSTDPRVDAALTDRLKAKIGTEEKLQVVATLAQRSSSQARSILSRIASRPFAVSAQSRALRKAARYALGKKR
jgi:hypothetical protein